MPKETTQDLLNKKWHVKVGWDKERGDVQVATIAPDMPLVTEDSFKESNGWHITLTRNTLNQLIRDLKKAGRQAFGEDEW